MALPKSLCWTCEKSCPQKGEPVCSWVSNQEPVAGWNAEPENRPGNLGHSKTYFVHTCPGYVRDTPDRNKVSDNGDFSSIITLVESILERFNLDYVTALKWYNDHPHEDTKNDVLKVERDLHTSIMAALLPAGLSIESYIKTMRNLYLTPQLVHAISSD